MKKLLLLFVLFIAQNSIAQQDAWVYLNDKPNAVTALANPLTILSQKALDRKALHGVVLDDRDVPVETTYITQVENATGITVMATSKWFNCLHVRGTETDINALLSFTFVSTVFFADTSLNAKSQTQQDKFDLEETLITFDYGSATNQVEMLNADDLHVLDYTGEGMTIAVIDAGFPNVDTMSSFQRLRDNGDLLNGYDFVDRTSDVYANSSSNHGTMVLSTMAGYVDTQYVGTAPDAKYHLFRTEDAGSENPVEESYWVEAAEVADSLGVNVINTSLGYTTYDNPNYNYTTADMNGNTAFITKGANIAFEKGMLLVNSAGNSGNSSWGIVGAPADAAGVFSIGAVNTVGSYATFSSRGNATQPTQKPDVVAQGASSAVINQNDVIITASGTSFSSPIMAGAIASFWQANPTKTNAEIMQLVRESSSQYAAPNFQLGYGIPDFSSALILLDVSEEKEEVTLFPNPTQGQFSVVLPETDEGITVSLYTILGKIVYNKVYTNDTNIDISFLADGIYIAEIKTDSFLKTIKIIKH